MTEMSTLRVSELATLCGEPLERLGRWQDLGLLSTAGQDLVPVEAVERVRLIQFALEQGVSEDEIARVNAEQNDLLANFTGMLGSPRTRVVSFEDAAVISGTDPDLLDRFWRAAGLHDQRVAYEDDLEALQWMNASLVLGLPEPVLLQMIRVFASSLGRVANAAVRLFHLHVHEQLRAEGLRGAELIAATQASADPLAGFLEPAVLYFHRKAWERAFRDDLILHLREDSRRISDVPGELQRAVLFADLSSFTPLTEAMGDTAAAQVLERFATLVHDCAADCGGEVVKQIGDALMLVFADATAAVRCGLSIDEQASNEPMFPAVRLGAHHGTALYREGDYIGATVNLAARIAASADRHQFLTTAAIRDQTSLPDVFFDALGPHALKGVAEDVDLFAARKMSGSTVRPTDPVCGMELDPGIAAGRLQWQGQDLVFCSTDCVQLFLDTPDRYRPAPNPAGTTRP